MYCLLPQIHFVIWIFGLYIADIKSKYRILSESDVCALS
jgi:hypothetical protein